MVLFLILTTLLIFNSAFANPLACPVCAIAIAGGLGISRILGVDDTVVGVWIGAILLALSQWTVYFFEKRNINNKLVKVLSYVFWYAIIIPVYLGKTPMIIFNLKRILGIDSFLFSIIAGSLTLFGSAKLYYYMKEKNGGKPHFQFEKVVLPIVSLIFVSLMFHIFMR